MQWPWQRTPPSSARLAFRLSPEGLAWLIADTADHAFQVLQCGLVGRDAAAATLRQLQPLPGEAIGLLELGDYQLLQVDAPPVPAEELRAAARWRIREMVDTHVDEVTIDVLRVGRPRNGAAQPLFVVAARNQAVRGMGGLTQGAPWDLSVIEVPDTTQRNLQSAAAARLDLLDRATACLVRYGDTCLLTISAGGELYYSRRLDWDERLLQLRGAPDTEPEPALPMAFELDGLGVSDPSLRLLTELQRSFDVWERSWPDLPLALMCIEVGAASAEVAEALQEQLGLRVLPLALDAGLSLGVLASAGPAVRDACQPLLGALLRERALGS